MDLDPEGTRLPIKIDSASNGEYEPRPRSSLQQAANRHARERCAEAAHRVGMHRRAFLRSLSGAAATLLAFNHVHARAGARGGSFLLPAEAAYDEDAARAGLAGDELIVDIQNHCVDPSGDWVRGESGRKWRYVLNQVFAQRRKCDEGAFDCYSAEQMVKEVFLDSDTDVSVVSALWGGRDSNPTPMDYAAEARALVNAAGGGHRGLIHGGVMPNEPGGIEYMETQAREYGVSAWKIYPQWGPDGTGYFMDDEAYGIPMIEKARELGVKVICAHRGLPLGGLEYRYSHPSDIARAARLYPDVTFICYHSGFEPGVTEGPYDPANDQGVDRLITAHAENGFRRNEGNLYAELGSVWRYYMDKPDQAAHLLGKLISHFGEERICWGTDALWYGSPQDQIQALRTFQISDEFQDRYGYPAITAHMRRRIFGLNAAGPYGLDVPALRQAMTDDHVAGLKRRYAEHPNPSFQTFGPRSRREFLRLVSSRGGRPA